MKGITAFINESRSSKITIRWSDSIGTDKIKNGLLSNQARNLLEKNDVVYLIDGVNSKGETVYYIGKADGATAKERLSSHQNNKADYIEGMQRPYKNIRIGEISGITKTKNAIDQIESHLIFTMAHSMDKSKFCNDQKTQSYTMYMNLSEIKNEGNISPLPNNVDDPVKAGIGEIEIVNGEKHVFEI